MENLHSNIKKLNIFAITDQASTLWSTVLFLFFAFINLEPYQFGILIAVGSVFKIAFEIPSGIIGDKFGRKKVLLISGVFGLITSVIFLITNSFLFALIAMASSGIKWAFSSGADTALRYDTLKSLKRENEFKKAEGVFTAFLLYAMGVSSIVAGVLSEFDFRFMFLASAIMGILNLIVISTLKEPKSHYIKNKSIIDNFKISFKFITNKKLSLYLVLFITIMYGFIEAIFRFHQLYVEETGMSLSLIGLYFSVFFIIAGISSHNVSRISKFVKDQAAVILVPVIIGITYLIVGSDTSIIFAIILLLEPLLVGYYWPLTTNIFNQLIPSNMRNSLLSFSNLFNSVFVIIFGIAFGFVISNTSLGFNYFVSGIFMILVPGSIGVLLSKHLK